MKEDKNVRISGVNDMTMEFSTVSIKSKRIVISNCFVISNSDRMEKLKLSLITLQSDVNINHLNYDNCIFLHVRIAFIRFNCAKNAHFFG